MRSRRPANEQVTEVARRRLELLSEELAGIRRQLPGPRGDNVDGPGELEQPTSESAAEQAPGDVVQSEPIPAAAGPDPESHGRHARRSVGVFSSAAGWLFDRLPPTLQGRVQLSSSHLSVIAVLVAAALAVTAWWVVRADDSRTVLAPTPTARPVGIPSPLVEIGDGLSPVGSTAPAAPAAPAGAAATSTNSPSAAASAVVVVDVAGKVRSPGIATLPLGSRVVDAIEAAGGARRGVDVQSLNLARLLVDGEQIVVGTTAPSGVAAPAASAPGATPAPGAAALVNLNTATQPDLETLPGVGPVTAQAILAWRTENGAFSSVDELLEVSGIGDATLAELAPFVTL